MRRMIQISQIPYLKIMKIQIKRWPRCQGRWLTGKVFTIQASGPKFRLQQTHIKAGWLHTYYPSSERWRQVDPGGLLPCQSTRKGERDLVSTGKLETEENIQY